MYLPYNTKWQTIINNLKCFHKPLSLSLSFEMVKGKVDDYPKSIFEVLKSDQETDRDVRIGP